MRSPYCEPEAAGWLVDQGAKVVGFDCFSERSAREPDFTSEDFVVHKAILDRGAILIQQLTGLSQLPVGVRVPFFAGFVPIRGAEGSPGRMFALIEEEESDHPVPAPRLRRAGGRGAGAGAAVMGGGTTVMPAVHAGALDAERVIGLARAGLDGIEREDGRTTSAR